MNLKFFAKNASGAQRFTEGLRASLCVSHWDYAETCCANTCLNQRPPVYTRLQQASVYFLSETHKNSGGVKFYTSGVKRFTPGKCVFPKANSQKLW